MLKIYLTVIASFFLLSCSDEFPTNEIIHVDVKKKVCDVFILVDKENIKYKFDHAIEFEKCPVVFGFKEKDTGDILSWIRRMKKKIEGC